MASLSAYYPLPVVAGTTAGTYAEGDKVAQLGAGSVVTSTGSTTARSLANRFGEVFHVDDYGAKGDWNGTTGTDDTAAIQAAINAAVAAGGGVIRFGAGKTYRLNTRNSAASDTLGSRPHHFLRIGSGNTTSGFGSSNMRLLFDGQQATLHATAFVNNQGNDIIYTCCQFKEIQFINLSFTRNNWMTSVNGGIATALSFFPFDANVSELIRIENCNFNNNLHSIYFDLLYFSVNPFFAIDIFGKLKRLEVIGCKFEHPNGSSRARGFGGQPLGTASGWPAVVAFNSPWIEFSVYDRCYADGLTNATVPAGYHEPMHGFLHGPESIHTNITNCYFKNFYVEIIKASDVEVADTLVRLQTGIVQPAENSTVSCQIASSFAVNGGKLVVGKIYGFYDGVDYEWKRGGLFRLEAKSGGGDYDFSPTSTDTFVFTRVDSSEYQLEGYQLRLDGSTYGGNWIYVIDMETLNKMSLNVSNCCFDGSQRILKEDGLPLVDGVYHSYSPAILIGYKAIISNNEFYGPAYCFSSTVSFVNHHGAIIEGNMVFASNPTSVQTELTAITTRRNNVQICNNRFIYSKSRDVRSVMLIGANDIIISNNFCIIQNPSSAGTNGVVAEPAFITYEASNRATGVPSLPVIAPWRVFSQENHLIGLGYYGFTFESGYVAHFYGQLRIGMVISPSLPIKLAKIHTSPDGSTWTVGVTNDGELEVSK